MATKYTIALSDIMAAELIEAVKNCATSRGGMTIEPSDYIRECVESVLASRRIERIAAK
jgi:phosphate uptake regulator